MAKKVRLLETRLRSGQSNQHPPGKFVRISKRSVGKNTLFAGTAYLGKSVPFGPKTA